mmetsp:Transcript_13090/g.15370  ORF Transcript_13090/g.15370 Transcript_13090/m.15370 type:complete len:156 (+) Transcript_13090:67-534(+)|eukprot:CAMPEP_0198264122 /NCGR_PEP_ID=MMETSP1447-20131203/14899_1 /TAXON_ID=420782 /ORGANISM="Chaetoceros dichaeta, Strain CCMP1751" /LENGTH=155 /DNA_ID=CAMNT_0043952971 /DNA_START=64 /DNA_END=531 /DNA_ORIENTATION=-
MMLSQLYPSLAPILSATPIVGLYFASSWCPDCTPVTPKLKSIYESQGEENQLEIVYISSDSTADQFQNTFTDHHGSWSAVPYENTDELAGIKRHFGACAGKEMIGLGMKQSDRKFGIPTLIIINARTEEVVSTEGLKDVEGLGIDALKKWEGLLE